MLYLFFDFEKANEDDFETFLSELPEFRREKIMSLKNMEDRLRSLFSFIILCVALRKKVRKFRITKSGKPMLENHYLNFSISHTKECVAVAISRNEIGVDVEYIRDYPQNVINRVLADKEKIQLLQSKNPNAKFFKFWTLKESFVKCTGTGIVFSLKEIEFDIKKRPLIADRKMKYKFNFLDYSFNHYQISICQKNTIKTRAKNNTKIITYEELKEKWKKLQCQ